MDYYVNRVGEFINQFLRDARVPSWTGESRTYGYVAIVALGLIILGIILSYIPSGNKSKNSGKVK